MKVVFCGGGTGGHVYPALTVAGALRRRHEGTLEMLYIGVRGKIDRQLVEREGIAFRAVTAGPLRVGSVVGAARGGLKLAAGAVEAFRILRRFRPEVVFATGGYGSVGVALAARALRIPLAVFLPDVEAGLAVKTLVRVAMSVAVSVPPALAAMPPAKTSLTGYPVRPEFFAAERAAARERLGLHPDLPLLLVAGGSTGARRLNQAVAGWLPGFLRIGQVVHVCGHEDEGWLQSERAALAPELQERYRLHAYLHDGMAEAMAAADVGVMRSGASTLGELPATGLPAVLVPGEYEGGSNQLDNAGFLQEQGAALMLRQDRIRELEDRVMELLADEGRRRRMKDALATLARPNAASDLATIVEEAAAAKKGVKTA